MQFNNGLAVLVFIGALSAVTYGSDVASKLRENLGMNCTSFDDCIAEITNNEFQAVRKWLTGSYNVVPTKEENKDEWTFSVNGTLPPMTVPLDASMLQQAGRFVKTLMPSLNVNNLNSKGQLVIGIGVDKPKTVVRHLKVNLTKPDSQTYSASVSATSLNASADLFISVNNETMVTENVRLKIADLNLRLRVTLAQQQGHLQVTDCTAKISYGTIAIEVDEGSKLGTLVAMGNIYLERKAKAEEAGKHICDGVLGDLNKVLRRRDHHQAVGPIKHHEHHH